MYCYIHIPFCTSKCKYCRFASFSNFDELKIQFYVDFLSKNILEKIEKDISLESIYFWWWTPSVLNIAQIKQILNALNQRFDFSSDIEISFETTPQNISLENLKAWKNLWINRMSIGIQSLNDKALKEIGRISSREIFQTFDILEISPIENISLDFIIGLPYTKKWELRGDIATILEKYTFPKHISPYMLEDYTYPKNWEEFAFPKEQFNEEYLEIKKLLVSKNISWYEISNFAKSGYECKHNKAYWNHSEIIAFWLWSYGFEKGRRYAYAENFQDYYAHKNFSEEILTLEDIRLEKIMFWIRTTWFDENLLEKDKYPIIQNYLKQNYLVKKWKILSLWEKWISLLDSILAEIV